jgi:hypothetical protein
MKFLWHGYAAWTCNMNIQHRYAARASSKDKELGKKQIHAA